MIRNMSQNTINKKNDIKKMTKYLSEYTGDDIKIMEVCGTHTAGIFKSGIRTFLSDKIKLISGPGCPVCVTPTSFIDKCNDYAMQDNHVVISFGDMLKVPGGKYSLSNIKSLGGNVSMVYSPFDVISAAKRTPEITYIIAAVGFETTAPVFGLMIDELIKKEIKNIKFLTSLKSAIRAIDWVCTNEKSIDGFLCPGHVAVITGEKPFDYLSEKYQRPFVIAGFEEQHILRAIYELVRDIESWRSENPKSFKSKNLYEEAVNLQGNTKAKQITDKYFQTENIVWRGLGNISDSGYFIKDEYSRFDGGSRGLVHDKALPQGCRCSDVITGRIDPDTCPMFGDKCNPVTPYGPCMVSAEGACGIWYQNI